MKTTQFKLYALLFFATAFMMSCSDDDDVNPDSDGDHDETAALILRFTDENGNSEEYEIEAEHDHDHDDDDHDDDHDHDGEEIEIDLMPNHTYTVTMVFENEEGENVTDELTPEEHLVCLKIEDANLTFVRNDMDANDLEVGFNSTWTTGAESHGDLELIVRHQIDKAQIGTENCDAGATDIEVYLHAHIED